MNPQKAGYGFEEDLADLMELNGYKVNKTARSSAGGVDIVATKTDEVGHEMSYIIMCKKPNNPVDRDEIDKILNTQKKYPGSIAVVVSASSGFTRDARELAETFGVRLWGEAEIENLRRNIRQKRDMAQKKDVRTENGQYPIKGGVRSKKRRSKRKFIAFLIILAIFFAYIIHVEPDLVREYIDLVEKQIQSHQSWGSAQSSLLDIYEVGRNRMERELGCIMGGNIGGRISVGLNTSKAYVSWMWGRLVDIC